MPEFGLLWLTMAVLSLIIITGVMFEWLGTRAIRPLRTRHGYDPDRPRLSIAETRRWERRLAALHVIDAEYHGPVKVVRPDG
jgi:hypothetical protein